MYLKKTTSNSLIYKCKIKLNGRNRINYNKQQIRDIVKITQ